MSSSGCIQVSQSTLAALTPGHHVFVPTGGIEVKGKGLMETFLCHLEADGGEQWYQQDPEDEGDGSAWATASSSLKGGLGWEALPSLPEANLCPGNVSEPCRLSYSGRYAIGVEAVSRGVPRRQASIPFIAAASRPAPAKASRLKLGLRMLMGLEDGNCVGPADTWSITPIPGVVDIRSLGGDQGRALASVARSVIPSTGSWGDRCSSSTVSRSQPA